MHRTPTKKSPIRPKPTSASKSPSKKEGLSDHQIEDKLRRNRERLTHTLDTYSMLIRSNTPIRCLEHNSVVSIFCETEGRLLCTNCVFGKNDHKFHRINPIDKSHERIRDSLQRLQPVVEKEMATLNHIKEIVLINLEQEVVDMEKGLEMLTIRYAEAHRLLEDSFMQAKRRLIATLEQLRAQHETVALELNFLRDVYDVKGPLMALDYTKIDEEQVLIYHHALLHTLAGQKKFEGNVWNAPRSQIRRICSEEERRVASINAQLATHLGTQH